MIEQHLRPWGADDHMEELDHAYNEAKAGISKFRYGVVAASHPHNSNPEKDVLVIVVVGRDPSIEGLEAVTKCLKNSPKVEYVDVVKSTAAENNNPVHPAYKSVIDQIKERQREITEEKKKDDASEDPL